MHLRFISLSGFAGQLVILDEVQRMPDLFPVLRSLIDERRRSGEKSGQFLLLGSALPELLRQSSETLAGRILAVEIKRTLSPKVTPGLFESMETLGSSRGFIVIPEGDAYPLSKSVTAAGLHTFLESPI